MENVMGSYIPATSDDYSEMLQTVGVKDVRELFDGIPGNMMISKLEIPEGLSELEVRRRMEQIASKNKVFSSIFRGAGSYDHYIPAIVKAVISKEEFVTAYTPYQAEISQGILQAIFEYQTLMCELTGMDASNASVYDGATAAAEGIAMCRERKRNKAVISLGIKPDVLEVIKTYSHGSGMELVFVPVKDGRTDIEELNALVDENTACIYAEQPNYFGQMEDIGTMSEIAHSVKAKMVTGCNPISLGTLETPAEYGADVAVGEGQPLGMPLGFGGPYLGFMTCKKDMTRKLPGRIVGETTDQNGERAFVLTLQAREQHIRREKASSNICSNEALCAMTAAVYLSAVGPDGLEQAALQCYSKSHYLAGKLEEAGLHLKYKGDYFNEFVTDCPGDPNEILKALEKENILGGLPLDDGSILWCVTEKNSKEDMDKLISVIKEVM
jgi:glycine dehydrogenase subunit 1